MSMTRTSNRSLYFLVGLYSLFSALSEGSSMGYALNEETGSPWITGIFGTLFGLVIGFTAYQFQGQAILSNESEEDAEKTEEADEKADLEKGLVPVVIKSPTCRSYAAQTAYMACEALSSGANRYFLVHTTYKLFGTVRPIIFYPIVSVTAFVEFLFGLTNGTAETTKALSKKSDSEARPCYAGACTLFSSPSWRTTIRFLGSMDHTITEMLSWSSYLTREMLTDLDKPENRTTRNLLISLGAIGVWCAIYIFIQTYGFEGRYTEKFLKKIHDLALKMQNKTPAEQVATAKDLIAKSKEPEISQITASLLPATKEADTKETEAKDQKTQPSCGAYFLSGNIALFGTAKHGESAAAPVYNVGMTLVKKLPPVYRVIPIVAAVSTAVVNAIVTYMAEIKPIIDELLPNRASQTATVEELPDEKAVLPTTTSSPKSP